MGTLPRLRSGLRIALPRKPLLFALGTRRNTLPFGCLLEPLGVGFWVPLFSTWLLSCVRLLLFPLFMVLSFVVGSVLEFSPFLLPGP